MGRKREDLTGRRYGRLTVISYNEEVSKQKGRAYWNCKCECGNEIIVRGDNLTSESTKSCGCYNRDKTKEQWEDEEFRQMQIDRIKEQWKDEDFRQKQKNGTKAKWQDEEFRQMQSDRIREMWKEMWQDEDMKWKMGYKGGITPISIYLRSLPVVKQWRKDTYIRENNKCQLTGKQVHGGNSDVHHLYGFNMIVLEAHTINAIEIKQQVKDYNEEELHKLEEYVASWHKDTSNAVLLCDEVHDLFHNCKDKDGNVLYGYGNNTPEQFEEFKTRYLNGEFDTELKEIA